MKRLFIVTLEKIDQRYTAQWYSYFKDNFKKYFDDVIYIDGNTVNQTIKKGAFLDFNNTNIYKAEQVIKIANLFNKNLLKHNDTFFFADGWHFGITALKYMSQLNDIKIKIYAYWHAGTWDRWDRITQVGMDKWAYGNEISWFNACDGNFVATKFHKSLIYHYFGNQININKIYVVGFPMNWHKEIGIIDTNIQKEDIIVFPHRLDKEKQPQVFDNIKKQFPNYKFIKTMEVTKNKKEYYQLLAKAKISFSASLQETFGIGSVEAMMLGCIPLVPNRLSYVELYNDLFKYDNNKSARDKLCFIMNNYDKSRSLKCALLKNQEKIQKQSCESIKKMCKVMLHANLDR